MDLWRRTINIFTLGALVGIVASSVRAQDIPASPVLPTPGFDSEAYAPLPDANIQFEGCIHKAGDDWHLDIVGTVNGADVSGSYVANLSYPIHRHWIDLMPFDDRDELYRVSRQYADSIIFDAIEAIDMSDLDIYFPDGAVLDRFEINLSFRKTEFASHGQAHGGGLDPVGLIGRKTVTSMSAATPVFHDLNRGVELNMTEVVNLLGLGYGFTPQQAGRFLSNVNPMSRAEVERSLIDGAQRKLAAMVGQAVPEMAKSHAYALAGQVWQAAVARGGADYQAFLGDAQQILLAGGADESMVQILIQGANSRDEETGNPLSTMQDSQTQSNPLDEIIVTLSATVDIEVSVPPFVTIRVSATASATGPASAHAEILKMANNLAKEAAVKLAAEMRRQLEDLKKLAEELAKNVKEWVGSFWDWIWSCAPEDPTRKRCLCRHDQVPPPAISVCHAA